MPNEETDNLPDFPEALLSLPDGARLHPPIQFGRCMLYELVRRSNMSVLAKGARADSDEEVAVKICRPTADRERFRREIDLIQKIGSTGVPKVKDSGKTKCGCPWYVTLWIKGKRLDEYLGDGGTATESRLNAVEQLCWIVGRLHQEGHVHRDVKPSNAMVELYGGHAILLDFGLAYSQGDITLTMSGGQVGGTPGYRPRWSFERPRFIRRYGKQWDVYSLTVILVEALAGVRPGDDGSDPDDDPRFTPDGIRRLLETLLPGDRRFDALLRKILSSSDDPRKCLRDANDLFNAIRECRGLPRKTSRAPLLAAAALGVVGVSLIGGVQAFRVLDPEGYVNAKKWLRPGEPLVIETNPPPSTLPGLPDRDSSIIENPSKTNWVLNLQVSPAGATTRVVDHRNNGRAVIEKVVPESGQLTLAIPWNPKAQYGLTVFKDGFQTNQQSVRPDSGPLEVHLDRLRGAVQLKTTPRAWLTLIDAAGNSRAFGQADADGLIRAQSLEIGEWAYRLFLTHHESATGTVTVAYGEPLSVNRPLKPLPGRLWVSGPSELEIWLETSRLGTAQEWISMAAGTNRVRLLLEGFREQALIAIIPPGQDVIERVSPFVPQAGNLRVVVDAPPAAREFFTKTGKRVFLDGSPFVVSSFPFVLDDVAVGSRAVRLEADGFLPGEGRADVRDAQTAEVRLTLQPLPAKVVILAEPTNAEVYLDGKERLGLAGEPLGIAPFTATKVEVRAPNCEPAWVNCPALEPNRTFQERVKLKPVVPEPAPWNLPAFLIPVGHARPAPLAGLYAGSREAQELQIAEARKENVPLEVESAKLAIALRYIPGGTFMMGSPPDERYRDADEVQHKVTISYGFYVAKFEVTQKLWREVMGTNPSYFNKAGDDAPVENVGWNEIELFLKKLCELEGAPPGTFRLLTEAEWEWACRAGTTGATYGALDDVAWNTGNSGSTTHPAGGKTPNAFGLHDMLGNVWEWSSDWYGTYESRELIDPTGPSSGSVRVYRGGSWIISVRNCRAANRFRGRPENRDYILGFRLALRPVQDR